MTTTVWWCYYLSEMTAKRLCGHKGVINTKETKLKLKRIAAGLTQAELAKSAQVTVQGYQRYEAGTRVPKADTAKRIALALNSTVEELF